MKKEDKVLFLDGFRMKIELLNSLWDRYNTLVSSMENCKAIEYSDMPKGGGGAGTDISDKISRKFETQQRIDKLTDRISDMRNELITEIDNNIFDMKINESTFLYYVSGMSKTEIGCQLGYSERQISRYINTGLDLIFND